MNAQSGRGRREAAIVAAGKLGPMRDDVAEAIELQRRKFAEKRAARTPPERRSGDRRTGPFDRREHESHDRRSDERRQFATMEDKLAAEAHRLDPLRFDARPADVSAFMLDDQLRGGNE